MFSRIIIVILAILAGYFWLRAGSLQAQNTRLEALVRSESRRPARARPEAPTRAARHHRPSHHAPKAAVDNPVEAAQDHLARAERMATQGNFGAALAQTRAADDVLSTAEGRGAKQTRASIAALQQKLGQAERAAGGLWHG